MTSDSAPALLARLDAHVPHDDDESAAVRTMRAFVAGAADPFSRATLDGHVTASAVVLDGERRALLLFHAKLALWVQPGGHVEPSDPSLEHAALREAREESGLPDLVLEGAADDDALLLDVDVHPIPANAKRAEPAHHHHDVCFLVRTARADAAVIDPDESRALRWVTVAELDSLPLDRATRRRLRKAFSRPAWRP